MKSRVLQNRGFRNLWLGQAISQFGDAMYAMTFLFMVGQITGDAAMVGYVGALQTLPYLIFSPYAGVLADRLDRRRLMQFSDLASTALMFGFAAVVWSDATPPVWTIFLVAFLLSTVNVFFAPAKSASIPRLVPGDQLIEANALSSATQNFMPMIGLAVSGSVLGALYLYFPGTFFLTAILVNGATFLASSWFISRLPELIPDRGSEARSHALADLKEGIGFIRRDHLLKVSLILSLMLNILIAPFMVAYIEANNLWFGGKYGTLASFEFGFMVGLVIGSIVVGKLRIRRPGLAYGIGLAIAGLCVAAMAFSRQYWLFLGFNVICGLVLPFATIPLTTYIQMIVPDAFRGRVNATLTMLSMGVTPIGMGLAGMLVKEWGLVTTFLIMGIGLFAVPVLGLLDRAFRQSTMPTTAEPVVAPEESLETGHPVGNLKLTPASEDA